MDQVETMLGGPLVSSPEHAVFPDFPRPGMITVRSPRGVDQNAVTPLVTAYTRDFGSQFSSEASTQSSNAVYYSAVEDVGEDEQLHRATGMHTPKAQDPYAYPPPLTADQTHSGITYNQQADFVETSRSERPRPAPIYVPPPTDGYDASDDEEDDERGLPFYSLLAIRRLLATQEDTGNQLKVLRKQYDDLCEYMKDMRGQLTYLIERYNNVEREIGALAERSMPRPQRRGCVIVDDILIDEDRNTQPVDMEQVSQAVERRLTIGETF